MAANSGQPGNDGLIDMFSPLLIVGALFIIVWAIWALHQETIIALLFNAVRFISIAGQYIAWLYPDSMAANFGSWSQSLHLANYGEYGWDAAKIMIGVISHTLALFIFPWMVIRVAFLSKGHVVNRFVRNFNLQMLAKRNAQYYAAIPPILNEDLINTPIHQGPWAMARAPMDYCLEHGLIYALQRRHQSASRLSALLGTGGDEDGNGDKRRYIKGWTEKKMDWALESKRGALPPASQMRLDRESCDQKLVEQLGTLWSGSGNLDQFEQCVLAIIYVGIGESLNKARALALEKAQSFRRKDRKGRHRPKIDMSGIPEILAKYDNHPVIKKVTRQHAYKTTVFCGLLEAMWKKGIFTTSEILWLRPVNRTLFYSLNQLGGDRPFIEASGPWAHYIVEKTVGQAVKAPCIEAGSDAIEAMLFEEEWIGSNEGLASEIEVKKAASSVSNDPADYVTF